MGSNNTNKLSPQEPAVLLSAILNGSNNTNKLSPQELVFDLKTKQACSNNTNKLSPQEHSVLNVRFILVQIIQINLVLKNPNLETSG